MNTALKRFFSNNIKELVTFGIIVLIFLISGIARPELFTKTRLPGVINSVLLWMPLNLTMAMGMMMVVIVQDIDLSIGSAVALSAMVAGMLFRDAGVSLWTGLLVSMAVGTLGGAFNGYLVSYLKIPAIIVTLGTMNAYRGLTYIISKGKMVTGYELPPLLDKFVSEGISFGEVLVPWLVVIALAIAFVFFLALRYTHFGREVYAVGSNREAAHLRGIDCKKTEFLIFLITGFLCGITAMMSAGRFGYVNPNNTGNGLEFVVISATIIGGVSVSGGKGTVIGVLLGCLLLGTINTMIAMVGIPGTVQRFSYGFIIVIALLIDRLVTVMQAKTKISRAGR
ncbi:MAG: ABC transporter permease [Treponema sp.]|jgi:ribose/xylose/arabinose/galactoside ABC-type transport system permease subunit|nr:ABC transporter permease [Treponema sp.]